MKPSPYPTMLAVSLLLAACASGPTREQRAADFQGAAGAPVKSFNYVGPMYSWEPLSDHSLVVYTRPSRAWLLDVGPCPDLLFSPSIALSSNVGQVSVGFDRISTDRQQFPCFIRSIRPLDLERVRAAQAERRRIDNVTRDSRTPKP